jgi:hypothetical protein
LPKVQPEDQGRCKTGGKEIDKFKVTPAIEASGYGISGSIGGLPRTTYYTPDGRIMQAIPNIRDYVVKDKDGKVIRQGTRDGNLDKGWLLYKPQVLKPYCKGCDRWHDTMEEVQTCIAERKAYLDKMERWARKEIKKEPDTQSLEKEVAELKALVKQLMEAKK